MMTTGPWEKKNDIVPNFTKIAQANRVASSEGQLNDPPTEEESMAVADRIGRNMAVANYENMARNNTATKRFLNRVSELFSPAKPKLSDEQLQSQWDETRARVLAQIRAERSMASTSKSSPELNSQKDTSMDVDVIITHSGSRIKTKGAPPKHDPTNNSNAQNALSSMYRNVRSSIETYDDDRLLAEADKIIDDLPKEVAELARHFGDYDEDYKKLKRLVRIFGGLIKDAVDRKNESMSDVISYLRGKVTLALNCDVTHDEQTGEAQVHTNWHGGSNFDQKIKIAEKVDLDFNKHQRSTGAITVAIYRNIGPRINDNFEKSAVLIGQAQATETGGFIDRDPPIETPLNYYLVLTFSHETWMIDGRAKPLRELFTEQKLCQCVEVFVKKPLSNAEQKQRENEARLDSIKQNKLSAKLDKMENDSNPNSVDPDDALARIQQEMSEQAAIEAKVQANIAKIHEKAEKDGLSEDIAQDFVEKYLQSLGR